MRSVSPAVRTAEDRERGQVLPLTALFLLVLFAFTALAVDYGVYLLARRDYQNTADSAALAGSAHLSRPITSGKRDDAREAAWEVVGRKLGLTWSNATPPGSPPAADTAASSPYTEGGWSVWVSTPPTGAGAKYIGDPAITGTSSIFVRIERLNPSFLARTFGINGRTIDAWATAGNLPSRWAVLGLCPRGGNCPSTAESITLSGTNTILRIVDGDLGSNWGLKIDGTGQLQLIGDSKAYLADTTCGASRFDCYDDPANVNNGTNTGTANARQVQTLPAIIDDPNYPLPPWIDNATAVPFRGNASHDLDIASGSGITQAGNTANVSCGTGSPIRIGPGRYRDITLMGSGSCVILDPTFGLTTGQRPGIYVIDRDLDIGNNSFLIGDGVTIFFASGARAFNPTGSIVLNNGNALNIINQTSTVIPADAAKYGAWTTAGNTPWAPAAGSPVTTSWVTPTGREVGIVFYVRRASSGTPTNIFQMSGQSGIIFNGVLYGPNDNIIVNGGSAQAAIGQVVGWTVSYAGNVTIAQTFDGPADERSYLLEPRTGQGD